MNSTIIDLLDSLGSTIPCNLSGYKVSLVWDQLCSVVRENYREDRATKIRKLGTFTFGYTARLQLRPAFILSEELAQAHRITQQPIALINGKHCRTAALNYASLALDTGLYRDEVESSIRAITNALCRLLSRRSSVRFMLRGIGVLYICDNTARLKFFKSFLHWFNDDRCKSRRSHCYGDQHQPCWARPRSPHVNLQLIAVVNMEPKLEYLFDKELLEDLDLSPYGMKFDGDTSHLNPEGDLIARPLSNQDYEKGFIKLLSQLTKAGKVTKADFLKRFEGMKKNGDYYVIVVEDIASGKLVATGMLEIEQKFIHSCALRGRVEEVIVDEEYRGKRLGKLILGLVTTLSKKLGCYKTTLECKTENLPFYEKFHYKKDAEHFMQLRFRD